MNRIRPTLLAAALIAACSASALAAGRVEVNFIQPERFADVGFGQFERDRTLKDLAAAMQTLGRRLPDGQTLRLDVTEVDLAGEAWPWSGRDLRILRGRADWPRMEMRWTLLEGNRTLKSGEAKLADMSYMQSLRSSPQGAFDHEKHMLRQWFDTTVAAR